MVPFIQNLLSVQQWLGDGELAETDWDGDSTMAGILQPISTYRPGTIIYPGLTLIPVWISNYMHHKVWDELTYPSSNFNGATVEV